VVVAVVVVTVLPVKELVVVELEVTGLQDMDQVHYKVVQCFYHLEITQ
tara:strand:+ start:871 stop:1014 length:144 start_codon:yes stop_codon:yes gene_type:complete